MSAKRCLWIVNHKTLLPIEVTLLASFGFETYVPKIVPQDPGYRSAVVDYSADNSLTLDRYLVEYLNRHRFYEQTWSPFLTDLLNENFSLLISSFSGYTTPLFEAIRKFKGTIIARVFGREHPARYSDFFPLVSDGDQLLNCIRTGQADFWFGQAFDNLAEVEDIGIRNRALDLPVGLPANFFPHDNTWKGTDASALFLCPNIMDSPYYAKIYEMINRDFGKLPLKIFGRQNVAPNDPRVLSYMSDEDLIRLYQQARVMVYPSEEPRHLHYTPLEAIIIGAPVLYRKGGLMERLAGRELPGQCKDNREMFEKASRLLDGDDILSDAIRGSQTRILSKLSDNAVLEKWTEAMQNLNLAKPRFAINRVGQVSKEAIKPEAAVNL
jgi:hypothetical protein